jgi:uncharacterized membrane protein
MASRRVGHTPLQVGTSSGSLSTWQQFNVPLCLSITSPWMSYKLAWCKFCFRNYIFVWLYLHLTNWVLPSETVEEIRPTPKFITFVTKFRHCIQSRNLFL